MPRFSEILETGVTPSGYTFSATPLKDLSASEYTLVQIIVDVSGSTSHARAALERTLKEIIKACNRSPRSANLLVRVTKFGSTLEEIHGFKLLGMIATTRDNKGDITDVPEYDNTLGTLGATALYQATLEGYEAIAKYGKSLMSQQFLANGVTFVITDGGDTDGGTTPVAIKACGEKAIADEALESHQTILVCIGQDRRVMEFGVEAGFSQVERIENATDAHLARLAAFVSKSIQSASQAIGTGGPSQPVQLVP